MTVENLVEELSMQVLTGKDQLKRDISSAYCCDLLSRVMANGSKDGVWITIQTHLNTVAVATLLDLSCIVIPEDIPVDEKTLVKAEEEQVVILSSPMTAYTISGKLYSFGILGE